MQSSKTEDDYRISPNLLQMGFMRRTLIAKQEKGEAGPIAQRLTADGHFPYRLLPDLARRVRALEAAAAGRVVVVHHEPSLFKMHSSPAGFREAFGSFKHKDEQPAQAGGDPAAEAQSKKHSFGRRLGRMGNKRSSDADIDAPAKKKKKKDHRRSYPH